MLFDHEVDPGELVNLADRAETSDLGARLSAELRAVRSRIPSPTD